MMEDTGGSGSANFLNEIIAHKRMEVEKRKRERPLEALKEEALKRAVAPSFIRAVTSKRIGLIAEIKHMSPSAALIRSPFDPQAIAKAYAKAGVQAISVLVDEKYFGGGEDVFRIVRETVKLPLLYKEFVIDPWQVWHASALGASAVLLIVSVLDKGELTSLLTTCAQARVEPLVEIHEEADLRRIKDFAIRCFGINNRDLRSMEIRPDTTDRLKPKVPASAVVISESGITSPEDVARLKGLGVHAVLVGEHLLKQEDLVQAVKTLMGKMWKEY